MTSIIRAYLSPKIPENYFRGEIYVLRYCGIEVVKDETILYKIYSYLSVFLWAFFYTFVELYEFYAAWGGEINTLASIFMYSLTHINGTIKIGILFFTRHKYKRIIKMLHEGMFKPDKNRGGIEEFKHVRNCIRKTENMLFFFSTCVFLVIASNVLDSVVRLFTKPREEWRMSWLPISIVDTTYYPMFEIGFLYQNISVLMAAFLIVATDLLTTSIIGHLSCQFNILKTAFRNVRNRAIAMKDSPEGHNKSLDECFEVVLRDSIVHHLLILDLAWEMEELCNLMMLVVFLISCVQLCFMLFQASLVPIGTSMFFKSLMYWVDISFQVYIYCFFADEVARESVNVIDAVMEMDWPGSPVSVQKSMVLVMGRALKPVHMTAGKFVPISLQTFMSIARASFSYFMVLRQMNAKDK